MKSWLLPVCLLLVAPIAAQRPTAEAARPSVAFWPLVARTGLVEFSGPLARPTAPALAQAEHVRAWLTATCAEWWEVQTGADSVQLYKGLLHGQHPTVGLGFALAVRRRPGGWQYRLFDCLVRSPTGTEVVHWLPLHHLLDDPDFRPDVLLFQQQLQRALPIL